MCKHEHKLNVWLLGNFPDQLVFQSGTSWSFCQGLVGPFSRLASLFLVAKLVLQAGVAGLYLMDFQVLLLWTSWSFLLGRKEL